jgi:hypothetical protein
MIVLLLNIFLSSICIQIGEGYELGLGGGLTLSNEGKDYEVTTKECPGGLFFTRPVNETCLCYNGM